MMLLLCRKEPRHMAGRTHPQHPSHQLTPPPQPQQPQQQDHSQLALRVARRSLHETSYLLIFGVFLARRARAQPSIRS